MNLKLRTCRVFASKISSYRDIDAVDGAIELDFERSK